MKKLSLFLISFWIFVSISEAQLRLPLPEVEKLPNGLTLVWWQDDRLPLLSFSLSISAGYRDDPAGKTGVSQLMGSLLDNGVEGKSAQQFARDIEKLGASRFVSVDEDTTTLGVRGLSEDADQLFQYLGDMALRPTFPQKEFSREKSRFIESWKHVGERSSMLASLAFSRVVTSGTSYARSNFINREELRSISRTDVIRHHKKHFIANGSVLLVIGKVDRKSFRKKVIQQFGSWEGSSPPKQNLTYHHVGLIPRSSEILLIDRPGLNQAQVRIGFQGPKISSPDRQALAVANTMLGGNFGSILNREIRERLTLSYGIHSSFSYFKDFGMFTIATSTHNAGVGRMVFEVLKILKSFRGGSFSEEDVSRAKDYLYGSFPLEMATLESVASRWATGYLYGLGEGYLNSFLPRVKAVTYSDVKQAVKTHFKLESLVVVIAGDAKKIVPVLKASGFSKIKKVNYKELF